MESNCSMALSGGRYESCLLVRQCVAGDDEAWEIVVGSVVRRVFWLSYRFTRRREDAEDLTQEILLRVYRNLYRFRQDSGSLQAWILTIARNLIIDHHRHLRHLPDNACMDELDGLDLVERRVPDPLHAAEQAEASEFLRSGLRRLSPHLRQAVELKDIEGMGYREIALHLKISEGTVKSRVTRGRVQLAKILTARHRRHRRPAGTRNRTFYSWTSAPVEDRS